MHPRFHGPVIDDAKGKGKGKGELSDEDKCRWYGDEVVPLDLLSEIYKEAKLSMDWMEGARDLELPEAYWLLVINWYLERKLQMEGDGDL